MDGRRPGQIHHNLLDFFPKDSRGRCESVTMSQQIRGMYTGDRACKEQLIKYLASCRAW